MSPWPLMIFDCDGVLVDSESLCVEIIVSMLVERGVAAEFATIKTHFDTSDFRVLARRIEDSYAFPIDDIFRDRFRAKYAELAKTRLQPIAGIREALGEHTGARCVATSGPPVKVEASLAATGLAEFFGDKVFSSYDIGAFKPDPGIFLHAAENMRTPPQKCLVIEDTVEGVQAAVRAGMKVIAYTGSRKPQDLKAAGAVLLDDMRDLLTLSSQLAQSLGYND